MWTPIKHPEEAQKISTLIENISVLENKTTQDHISKNTIDYLGRQLDKAWSDLRIKQLKEWPGAHKIADQIEKRLSRARKYDHEKIHYIRRNANSGTIYLYCRGKKLRISNHDRLIEDGGYNKQWSIRYAKPDIDLTPHSGISCSEAIKFLLEL